MLLLACCCSCFRVSIWLFLSYLLGPGLPICLFPRLFKEASQGCRRTLGALSSPELRGLCSLSAPSWAIRLCRFHVPGIFLPFSYFLSFLGLCFRSMIFGDLLSSTLAHEVPAVPHTPCGGPSDRHFFHAAVRGLLTRSFCPHSCVHVSDICACSYVLEAWDLQHLNPRALPSSFIAMGKKLHLLEPRFPPL